ncbi:periplasmic protein involved in polysaccharide export [Cytophaga hutchinsonii ATCC 33406]|uniref:Periplasmic protein involved in polysaccharide export n=2 Tax=Cytophaga hutchinsonii TaxID=985 RepID=A0A6N4SWQ9_CYTH3|nr:periplasmic protein involved in polysaccharide export [Cytophaga hutchinsonii ATCC 33406]SFX45746.1 polysaccharide export outer membrane protein [Cytophaga hutchinsonii ATCC 33406]
MKKIVVFAAIVCIISMIASCKSYHDYKMFQTDTSILVDSVERLRNKATSEYKIEINDVITLDIYTNNGEKLVDPNNALTDGQKTAKEQPAVIKYTIYSDGCAHLPMVGNIVLKGFTVYQADSILTIAFAKYYTEPYVKTTLLSKRVIVFGPDGGKIIPLEYQNMNLVEIIARYGGIRIDGKATNIRVLRGDLRNPDVQLINLNTVEGMKLAYMDMEPGDIVYIEPSRKVFKEVLSDVYPLVGITTSVATLYLIIKTSTN